MHFGAHRCATTSFQEYMRQNAPILAQQGVAFWGPEKTRETELRAFRALSPRARTRLRRNLIRCERRGAQKLLISEENFLGTMGQNVKHATLYPNARIRAERLAEAFDGKVTKLVLNIRSLDTYWASVAAYCVRRGEEPVPGARWKRIVSGTRSWRSVITDLAAVFPQVPLVVLPFEDFVGRPQSQLVAMAACHAPVSHSDTWLNKDKDPGPQGMTRDQALQLLTIYADDLSWLAEGADGMAELGTATTTDVEPENSLEPRMDEKETK